MPVDITTIEQVPKITENIDNTLITTTTTMASNTNPAIARKISRTTTITTFMDKCRCIERMTGYFVANPDDFCSSESVSPKGKL